ncbi:MAG: riboflavin kinase [Brevinema sp.]
MIYKQLSSIKHSSALHVIVGAFDGVHYAHQVLIQTALTKAQGDTSLIFSFDPLPKEYFLGDHFLGALLPSIKRQKMLEDFQATYTIIADFTVIKDYSEEQFINILLEKADKIILYSGPDFRMGHHKGNPYQGSHLERIILDDILIDQDLCRSSKIRELLLDGEILRANKLLNKEYKIYSHTVPGDKIGRTIDFPTINITPTTQITPKNGVYFGEIKIFNRVYPAAIYVGKRPTVRGLDLRVESHIIEDFPYEEIPANTPAEVSFIKKICEEKSFQSLEELKKMLYNYKIISLGLATKRYKNQSNRLSWLLTDCPRRNT